MHICLVQFTCLDKCISGGTIWMYQLYIKYKVDTFKLYRHKFPTLSGEVIIIAIQTNLIFPYKPIKIILVKIMKV